jgi:hypothetical protein
VQLGIKREAVVPTPTMPAGTDIYFTLPDQLKIAIADALVLFSKIEACSTEIVWLIKGADLATKKRIVKKPASELTREIRTAMEAVTPIQFSAVWKAFETLANERNLIAHGVWMIAGGVPHAFSHKLIEDEDAVVGEPFDDARFALFMTKAEHLFGTLVKFRNLLDPQPDPWRLA